jgi:RNA polymerase sigma-70 factor (ECF subfamily)
MVVFLNQEVFIKPGTNIERIKTIDEDFKKCFLNYFEGLYTYAFTILKNNEDAKDVCQQAFIKLWEKRKSVNLVEAGRAYLYTTVYHISLNKIRDQKKQGKLIQYTQYGQDGEYINTAELKELKNRINRVIDSLPARCKEVFIKSRIEGKKYSEIATEMNISIKTVEVQMGKALRVLRAGLSDFNELYLFIFFLTNLISN